MDPATQSAMRGFAAKLRQVPAKLPRHSMTSVVAQMPTERAALLSCRATLPAPSSPAVTPAACCFRVPPSAAPRGCEYGVGAVNRGGGSSSSSRGVSCSSWALDTARPQRCWRFTTGRASRSHNQFAARAISRPVEAAAPTAIALGKAPIAPTGLVPGIQTTGCHPPRMVGCRAVAAAATGDSTSPSPPNGLVAADADAQAGDEEEDEQEGELYLGPAPDLVSALEVLSCTRTFTDMCMFLEHNSQLFCGPEVAAVVLQAAVVSELAAQRQLAAAMGVAEQRSDELQEAAAAAGGGEGRGALTPEAMADAMELALRAAGPNPTDGNEDTVLDELDAAEQLMMWATPLLRSHIKRYPPDATSALLSALAQLQQYDRRLMELAAEAFKADPRVWLRRAAPPSSSSTTAADAVTSFMGFGGGDGDGGDGGGVPADPWFTLVSLAGAFARLGHYDRALMAAIAQQAMELMPEIWERADAEDVSAEAAAAAAADSAADGAGGARGSSGGGGVTSTLLSLVTSFLDMYHLEPGLMQAAGEHLAAFAHQLDRDGAAEALLAFATFNARNPAFYSLMLRRLTEGPPGPISPRGAGALYRACVLISAMGDVPELSSLTSAAVAAPTAGPSAAKAEAAAAGVADAAGEEARRVGDGVRQLLRECLEAFPLSAMHAAPLGRPSPDQLEAVAEVPELLEAWATTGLLTVPQILSTLQQLPVEPLPPTALAETSLTAAAVYDRDDAVAWVPPDALLLYDGPDGIGAGFGAGAARIAIKALDEGLHCCRNVGQDPDSEPDRPGPRSGVTGGREAAAAVVAPSQLWRRRRLLRVRGPALSELRCFAVWGWRVLVVPVGVWGDMEPADRRMWMVRHLDELVAEAEPEVVDRRGESSSGGLLGPELWV